MRSIREELKKTGLYDRLQKDSENKKLEERERIEKEMLEEPAAEDNSDENTLEKKQTEDNQNSDKKDPSERETAIPAAKRNLEKEAEKPILKKTPITAKKYDARRNLMPEGPHRLEEWKEISKRNLGEDDAESWNSGEHQFYQRKKSERLIHFGRDAKFQESSENEQVEEIERFDWSDDVISSDAKISEDPNEQSQNENEEEEAGLPRIPRGRHGEYTFPKEAHPTAKIRKRDEKEKAAREKGQATQRAIYMMRQMGVEKIIESRDIEVTISDKEVEEIRRDCYDEIK